MAEKLEVGQILKGKVTGIQPYGAFVALNEEVQGLVHISEVTHGFVKDINDHLTVGDEVSVKVLSIDEEKIKYLYLFVLQKSLQKNNNKLNHRLKKL